MTREGEDALWQQVFTAQPGRRRVFEPSAAQRLPVKGVEGLQRDKLMLEIEKLRSELAAENRRTAVAYMTAGAGLLAAAKTVLGGIAALARYLWH